MNENLCPKLLKPSRKKAAKAVALNSAAALFVLGALVAGCGPQSVEVGQSVQAAPAAAGPGGPVLSGVSATASSYETGAGKKPERVVNRSGLFETSPGSGVFVHTNDPFAGGGSMWNSGYQPAGADHAPTITFDLGKTYTVNSFHVWNYNEKGYTSRGFQSVDVSASPDGKTYTPAGTYTFDQADGTPDYAGQEIRLKAPVTGRFVQFHAASTYRGDDPGGLSSVEFNAVGPGAPPPRPKKPKTGQKLPPRYARPLLPKPLHGAALPGGENVVFPANTGIVDVTQAPYFAKGDGIADDTQAIQQALSDHAKQAGSVIYLPNGVYLVSDTLRWPPQGVSYGFESLQGQSRNGTVIKLADSTFTGTAHPKAVIGLGAHGSADFFDNMVRNLTIDTGVGNPGAEGMQFFSNNSGCVRDVIIQSGDGYGAVGLDLAYNDQNGPLLVKNVKVIGFDVGIACGHGVNSQTLEHIAVLRQSRLGFENNGQRVTLRDLSSTNSVPALSTKDGLMTLVDSTLTGSGPAAIVGGGGLYARNVRAAGYARLLDASAYPKAPSGPAVTEYSTLPAITLFPSPLRSLNLAIKETPDVPWDAPKTWANVKTFKKAGDKDDTAAAQAAIDSGATTVYFPVGQYTLGATVLVRGAVRRIIGGTADVEVPDSASPGFKIVAGAAPVVVFERINSGYSKAYVLENASARTLVVKDCTNVVGNMTGPGEVFVEDVCANPTTRWTFGHQKVWARQFNIENQGTHCLNDGGTLWILGLKTERGGTLVETKAGGSTEVLGGLSYTTTAGKLAPMFVSTDSSVSVTLDEQWSNPQDDPYTTVISETRGSVTKTLPNTERRGTTLGLYAGYAAKAARAGR